MDPETLGNLLDEADHKGTIDYDDPASVERFMDDLDSLLGDRTEIPDARDLTEEEKFDWTDFFDEYDLWDVVRDEWEEGSGDETK